MSERVYSGLQFNTAGMAKYIEPIDMNVYEAAKDRVRHLLDTFDTIAVAFSGGKDSLTTLNLVEEVYRERGIKAKPNVFFRDEELIPDEVIDFVCEIRNSGRFNFSYFAIPLKSTKFILGRTFDYVQFDPNREWVRQPPPFAIRLPAGDKRIFDQRTTDDYICSVAGYKGRVAIACGIRADESLIRFRSCINKKNDNYITATDSKRVFLAKPIYDWTENDVFKYFCRRHIKYCPIYDCEMFNGEQLRVATPLLVEGAKRLYKWKTRVPSFYDRLIKVFPEVIVQAEYYTSLAPDAEFAGYEQTLDGLLKYIAYKCPNAHQRELANKRIVQAWRTRTREMAQGSPDGGYPIRYLFKCIQTGAYKRELLPKNGG